MWDRWWRETLASGLPPVARGEWLRWLLAAAGIWLLVATQGLWWNRGVFPQVPWFAWGLTVPQVVDLGLLTAVIISLLAIGMSPASSHFNRASLCVFALALLGLILLDQHRSQPWAYQFVLMAIVLASAPHRAGFALLRLLTISIYFHSAVSKCDYSFCTGLGQSFLKTLIQLATLQTAGKLEFPATAGPLVFPLGELCIALGLIWPRTRTGALGASIGMHVLLILILGPWGLQHSAGVLIWNGYFIVQNWLLFARSRQELVNQAAVAAVPPERGVSSNWLAVAVTTAAVAWPCLEPCGGCDVWPAWGLYAQHGEQLRVTVTEQGLRRLPAHWRSSAVLRDDNRSDDNRTITWQLRPQLVALQATRAPLYPQNRYLFGVILNLCRQTGIAGSDVSAEQCQPANRWTGERTCEVLANLEQIEQAARRQWWNALPRQRGIW